MSHTCHAIGCDIPVPPKMFMCRTHWYMVPKHDRDLVWMLYRGGQEVDKNPSHEYVTETQRIIRELQERINRKQSWR